jgi:hypothetical protein
VPGRAVIVIWCIRAVGTRDPRGKAAWRSNIMREGRDRRESILEAGNVRPALLVELDMHEGQKAEILRRSRDR